MTVLSRGGKVLTIFFVWLVILGAATASAWHDQTHLAVAKAAEYDGWYNAVGPDIARAKFGATEGNNHWCNNSTGLDVTPSLVLGQAAKYNKASDGEGHLYGAIVASLRSYLKDRKDGRYGEYQMAYCVHYIGELSMPLHNVPYDSFNEAGHNANDGVVEVGVLNNIGLIQKNLYPIVIKDEEDLAREIARIANISRRLAARLKEEDRNMTQDEAYAQLSHSASLLRAVLDYARRISP